MDYHGNDEVLFIPESEMEIEELSPQAQLAKRTKEIENDPNLNINVSKRLSNPNALITEVINDLKGKKDGHYRYRGVLETSNNLLDIRVSSKSLPRTLRFMDTLVKLLTARKHTIKNKYEESYVLIGEQEVKICFREKLKRVYHDDRWRTMDLVPTNILTFRVRVGYSSEKIFSDGKVPLENHLAKILAWIEIKATKYRDELEKSWEQNRIREEQLEKEREVEKQKQKEIEDFKDLFKIAQRRHQAKFIRDYLNDLERSAQEKGILNSGLKEWIGWAHRKVDWFDPFIQAKDDLLVDITPDQLQL